VVVTGVAGVAAIVSYTHIEELAFTHGQPLLDARLEPLSVDGLILAASLVLLEETSQGHRAPLLARCMLWLGITATVAANVAYGARYGFTGAAVSAWPAAAFAGAAEMLMGVIRRRSSPAAAADSMSAEDRARAALAASMAAGNPLSARQLHSQFGVSRDKAAMIKAELAAAANGQGI
jgi:hypothetical protein